MQLNGNNFANEFTKNYIFLSDEDFFSLINSKKINIGSQSVPQKLIEEILTNNNYFNYAKRFFSEEIFCFRIATRINGDVKSQINYNKTTIIKAIDKYIIDNNYQLTTKQQNNINLLKHYANPQIYIDQTKNHSFKIKIDNINFEVPVIEIINFIEQNTKDFINVCQANNIYEICGIKKEYFIFAAYTYFKNEKLLDSYCFSNNAINNYKYLASSTFTDFEAFNKCLNSCPPLYANLQMNENLKSYLLNNLPAKATNLEKAIYLYIKMCKTFIYNSEYFAVSQRGELANKHKDISFIKTITKNKNQIVCYEFNAIYAHLLNILGIKINIEKKLNLEYGGEHENLIFRVGLFLVEADSVTSILEGDLSLAKMNKPLIGIKSLNINEGLKKDFLKALSKMYKLVIKEEQNILENNNLNFNKSLLNYSKLTNNKCSVSLDEKFEIFLASLSNSNLSGIDLFSYALQLRRSIFSKKQRENNISFSIIKSAQSTNNLNIISAVAIIAINKLSFLNNSNSNKYYLIKPGHPPKLISLKLLQSNFNNGIFSYIDYDDPIIPEIKNTKGVKK